MNGERPEGTAQRGSREAVGMVLERFEEYLDDVRTRARQAKPAGTTGTGALDEIDRLARDTRQRIERAGDPAEAERAFQLFKEDVQRMRP